LIVVCVTLTLEKSTLRHQTPAFSCFSLQRILYVLEPLLEELKQMLDGEAPLKWDPSN
jgi:hypothetical protein